LELVDGLTRVLASKKLGKEVWWEDDKTGQLKLDTPIQRRRAELQANLKIVSGHSLLPTIFKRCSS